MKTRIPTNRLSKKRLSQLFLEKKTCLLEVAALIIYSQRNQPGLSPSYIVTQSSLDFIDGAIQKHGESTIDLAGKDAFVIAGVVLGHYMMAQKLGLIVQGDTSYKLDPVFEEEIKTKIIDSPSSCEEGSYSLIKDIILDSF